MKQNKKGFTIVELVIVIAVIAILAAVLIPTFANVITKSKQSACMQAAKAKFEEIYALDNADGTLDMKDTTATSGKQILVTALGTDGKATDPAINQANTGISLGDGESCTYEIENYEVKSFTYSDGSYTATYKKDSSNKYTWTVS